MAVATPITTQGRVIWALILREIKTLYGNAKIGYLWEIIKTGFGIGFFWGLRALGSLNAPHGMSMPIYLLAGYFIWNIFSDILTKSLAASDGNKSLLTYAQVTPLDIILSRVAVITATETLTSIILLIIASILGYSFHFDHLFGIIAAYILCVIWSTGIGLIFFSIANLWPTISNLVPMVLRILFFTSGVFFSPNAFASKVGTFLLYNPVLQYIEWLRSAITEDYYAPDVDYFYLIIFTLAATTLGLLLERYTRKHSN